MIIFLHGPDTFRSQHKLRELKQKFLKEVDSSGINIWVVDGKNANLEQIEKAILAVPFLAQKRMVIFENIFAFVRQEKIFKTIFELIQKKQAKNTITIFWEAEVDEKKFGANPLYIFLIQQQFNLPFPLLNFERLKLWIQQKVKECDGSIGFAEAQHLASVFGPNLWSLNSELEKLSAYKKNQEITLEDIKTLTYTKWDESIYTLTNALGSKNKAEALKLISLFLRSGVSISELLYKCLWQCKNLLKIKSFLEEEGGSAPSNMVASRLGLHPFIVKKCLAQIHNFTLSDLCLMHSRLVDMDAKIKTGHGNPKLLLELFFVYT